ncbi:MAG: hypothetical protein IKX21_01275, partial [Deltaproteobacteria bacterium]|nr:hypothetical protein [Deltaproteobacteria bacterium]
MNLSSSKTLCPQNHRKKTAYKKISESFSLVVSEKFLQFSLKAPPRSSKKPPKDQRSKQRVRAANSSSVNVSPRRRGS